MGELRTQFAQAVQSLDAEVAYGSEQKSCRGRVDGVSATSRHRGSVAMASFTTQVPGTGAGKG